MQLNDYQQEAQRTAGYASRTERDALANAALGLAGEAGEVADLLKKHLFHAAELDHDAVVKELGDVLWYVANCAALLGVPLADVAARNVAKLRARYPDGFDPERSRVRGAE